MIHVGTGSSLQFLFAACCSSLIASSTVISWNCSNLDGLQIPSNDGRVADDVDERTDSTLAEKLFEKFSALTSPWDGIEDLGLLT